MVFVVVIGILQNHYNMYPVVCGYNSSTYRCIVVYHLKKLTMDELYLSMQNIMYGNVGKS